jgi:hypothetical protein
MIPMFRVCDIGYSRVIVNSEKAVSSQLSAFSISIVVAGPRR